MNAYLHGVFSIELHFVLRKFMLVSVLHTSVYVMFQSGETPLHMAASRDTLDIVRILLEHGANVNVQKKVGDWLLGFSNVATRTASNGALDSIRTFLIFN